MEIETILATLIGIVGVLCVVLAIGSLHGGEWESVAQYIAPVSVAIVVFAIVIGGIATWRK